MKREEQGLRIAGAAAAFIPNRMKYIGVFFECCSAYARIYINREKTSYVGWCPKCAHRIEIKIGKEGTDSRFFRVIKY